MGGAPIEAKINIESISEDTKGTKFNKGHLIIWLFLSLTDSFVPWYFQKEALEGFGLIWG